MASALMGKRLIAIKNGAINFMETGELEAKDRVD